MKKQIFILVVFVLAAFANVTKSYGQCTPGPLTPGPGVVYPYTVTVSGVTNNATYLWYVTQDVNLLDATKIEANDNTYFKVDASESAYNTTTGGKSTIKLSWTSGAIGKTFYLVEKTTAEGTSNGTTCTVENLKVYEIKPINTFLLAVVGSDITGDATKSETCVANVTGATVSGSDVTYTYGQNTIYYKVTASGILGEWRPSIQLPALAGASEGQNYESADWASDGSTWHTFGLVAGDKDGGDFSSTDNASVTDASAGSSIIVRIVINNVNYETLADQAVEMAIDGYLPSAYSTSDVVSSANCTEDTAFNKKGTSTIKPRPTIAPDTTNTGAFMNQLP